jgi:hypothetical protein
MIIYKGFIFVVSAPPDYLKKGAKVIVNEEMKTLERVEGDTHLSSDYTMAGSDKVYGYNDIWLYAVQPILHMNAKSYVWFENDEIVVMADTVTNYGCMINNEMQFISKSSLCVYLLPEYWHEASKYEKGIDKIKFKVFKNDDNQFVPNFWNSKSAGYHAKLI